MFATVSVKGSLIQTGSINYLMCIIIIINRGGFALTSEHARHSLSRYFGGHPSSSPPSLPPLPRAPIVRMTERARFKMHLVPKYLSLGSLERLELLRQNELTATVHMVHDFLFEQRQLVPENVGGGNQLRVLALKVFDPVL